MNASAAVTPLLRGRVYLANLAESGDAPKPWLVVSNNARNRGLGSALAVRITTTAKYADLATVVELPAGECVVGWARCDELTTLWPDEPVRELGGLSPRAMRGIELGLLAALGIAAH